MQEAPGFQTPSVQLKAEADYWLEQLASLDPFLVGDILAGAERHTLSGTGCTRLALRAAMSPETDPAAGEQAAILSTWCGYVAGELERVCGLSRETIIGACRGRDVA